MSDPVTLDLDALDREALIARCRTAERERDEALKQAEVMRSAVNRLDLWERYEQDGVFCGRVQAKWMDAVLDAAGCREVDAARWRMAPRTPLGDILARTTPSAGFPEQARPGIPAGTSTRTVTTAMPGTPARRTIPMPSDKLREALAALEHDQWNSACSYIVKTLRPLLSRIRIVDSPEYEAAQEALRRWVRQAETPYEELTEKEKGSDREWADKVLAVLARSGPPNVTPGGYGTHRILLTQESWERFQAYLTDDQTPSEGLLRLLDLQAPEETS